MGMNTNVLQFYSFCKPTFSGDTRVWDTLYIKIEKEAIFELMGSIVAAHGIAEKGRYLLQKRD
jgi:hypothetical protein